MVVPISTPIWQTVDDLKTLSIRLKWHDTLDTRVKLSKRCFQGGEPYIYFPSTCSALETQLLSPLFIGVPYLMTPEFKIEGK